VARSSELRFDPFFFSYFFLPPPLCWSSRPQRYLSSFRSLRLQGCGCVSTLAASLSSFSSSSFFLCVTRRPAKICQLDPFIPPYCTWELPLVRANDPIPLPFPSFLRCYTTSRSVPFPTLLGRAAAGRTSRLFSSSFFPLFPPQTFKLGKAPRGTAYDMRKNYAIFFFLFPVPVLQNHSLVRLDDPTILRDSFPLPSFRTSPRGNRARDFISPRWAAKYEQAATRVPSFLLPLLLLPEASSSGEEQESISDTPTNTTWPIIGLPRIICALSFSPPLSDVCNGSSLPSPRTTFPQMVRRIGRASLPSPLPPPSLTSPETPHP